VTTVADYICLASTSLTQLTLQSNIFPVITQNKGHYAVQGHSRSAI